MTIKELIDYHYNLVDSKAEAIKSDIDSFLTTHKDEKDILKLYRDFISKFETVIYNFDGTYSKTCPEAISNTQYAITCFQNSLTISINLKSYFKDKIKYIYDKFPTDDDSLEIQ